MRVAETVMSTATAEMPVAAAMTSAMSSAVAATTVATTAMAAAFADRGARQQGHQNDDGNSDDPFGHGSLLRHLLMFGAGMTPTSEESSTGKAA